MILAGHTLTDWIRSHEDLVLWAGISSIVMFFGTLIAIPIIITRMGHDYFMPQRSNSFASLHPAPRLLGLIAKNLLGVIFLIMGFIMIFIPGQGLLTILMGLAMLNFPGKRKTELRLAQYPPLRKSIDWIRLKANRPPFLFPNDPASGL